MGRKLCRLLLITMPLQPCPCSLPFCLTTVATDHCMGNNAIWLLLITMPLQPCPCSLPFCPTSIVTDPSMGNKAIRFLLVTMLVLPYPCLSATLSQKLWHCSAHGQSRLFGSCLSQCLPRRTSLVCATLFYHSCHWAGWPFCYHALAPLCCLVPCPSAAVCACKHLQSVCCHRLWLT